MLSVPRSTVYALELHVWLGGSVNVAAIHVPTIMRTVKE